MISTRLKLCGIAVFISAASEIGRAAIVTDLYVANAGSNQIIQITPDGLKAVFANTGLDNPRGMAFDRTGNLYVANFGNNTVERFTPEGVPSVFVSSGLNQPRGLAFDAADNLYIANNDGSIRRVTPGGQASTFAAGSSLGLGMAFDRNSDLFVARGDSIERYTPNGIRSVFATLPTRPLGLAFNSEGDLFATTISIEIYRFPPQGRPSVFANTELNNPYGLAFDRDDNLYVVNRGYNRIDLFANDGTRSVYAQGLNAPTFLAFQGLSLPVPEPSAFLALIAGAGMFISTRRKRSSGEKTAHDFSMHVR